MNKDELPLAMRSTYDTDLLTAILALWLVVQCIAVTEPELACQVWRTLEWVEEFKMKKGDLSAQ